MPYLVGLTGGIGSGKTTVANLFAALGAGIVDTDEIAKAQTAPGMPAVADIGHHFGAEYVTADGALDRGRMRKLVFGNANARRELEGILHPRIRQESQRMIAKTTAPYAIVVVPLLLETRNYRGLANRVLVVDCTPEVQIERVMKRSGLAREEVLAIMDTQLPRAERLRNADDIVHNDGEQDALQPQILALHQRYLKFARQE
jgi:dephospho-CoA kinase